MKILDKYILKSFIITFTSVFVILFFIFILQGVWLFISELAGKDLDLLTISKFLLYYSPTIVPLVLPLSVLLSSIMTFGNFAENYEFAAMKSAGISLQRAMKFPIFAIFVLAIIAFFFSNNVIPNAQFKFINLRKSIVQQKPALAIAQGQFNQIGNINIKVDEKSGDKGQYLKGIIIHKKGNNGNGANTVIKSKKGYLSSNESDNILNLELFDGNYYEEIIPKKYEEQRRIPFAKSSFEKYILSIDLNKLNESQNNNDEVISTYSMLNILELKISIDSLERKLSDDKISFSENIIQRNYNLFGNNRFTKKINSKKEENLLSEYSLDDKRKILEIAFNNITSINFSIETGKTAAEYSQKNINQHWVALHEKIMLAFSCVLLFFIGAPLGAIIRKGGLGLPMVFAILIFIIFHFTNTFGKKLAEEASITPFLGTWLSTIILIPFAILLTYRATNDIGIMINFDWIVNPIKKTLSKFKKQKTNL